MRLNLVTFVGIASPVTAGAIVLAYGTRLNAFRFLPLVAAGIGVIQIVVFIWSVVARWEDSYQRANQAGVANQLLSMRYQSLAEEQIDNVELAHKLDVLNAFDDAQRNLDEGLGIKPRERKFGYRAALLHFKSECRACGALPRSMEPRNSCGTCSGYPYWWR